MKHKDLIERLETRASIRRNIATRKSVQEGKPDRISDLLEEAAYALRQYENSTEPYRIDSIVDSITKRH